jgi:hypothetical protein
MSWMGARGRDPNAMLMLRYEDLVGDPQSELGKIAEFLNLAGLNLDGSNLDGSPARIRSALKAAQDQATPQDPGKWSTVLPETAAQAIASVWGPVMTAMGYTLQACGDGALPRPGGTESGHHTNRTRVEEYR